MKRIAESGNVYISGNNANIANAADSASVSFSTTYDNPVIVAHTATNSGGQPVEDRVTNVTSSGFDLFAHEPDNQGHNDNRHTYLVAEQGVWLTPEENPVEAGIHQTETTARTGKSFDGDYVSFDYDWSQRPAVFATVNTHNNGTFSTAALNDVTTDGFYISQLTENGQPTEIEKIGWIALPQGDFSFDGNTFEAGIKSGHSLTTSQSYSSKPDYIADWVAYSGTDPRWVRGGDTWNTTDIDWYLESGSSVTDEYSYFAIDPNSAINGYPAQGDGEGTLNYISADQLKYEWYDTQELYNSQDHPSNASEFDSFFDASRSDVTFGGSGLHTDHIDWSSSLSYLPEDGFSWKVTGYIYCPESGEYTFGIDGDDSVDVAIDGTIVASWYGGHGMDNDYGHNGAITLDTGLHSVTFRHEEGSGGEGASLGWQKPSDSSITTVPQSQFYSATELGGGYSTSDSTTGGTYSGPSDHNTSVEEHPDKIETASTSLSSTVATSTTEARSIEAITTTELQPNVTSVANVVANISSADSTQFGFELTGATASVDVSDGVLASPKRSIETTTTTDNSIKASASSSGPSASIQATSGGAGEVVASGATVRGGSGTATQTANGVVVGGSTTIQSSSGKANAVGDAAVASSSISGEFVEPFNEVVASGIEGASVDPAVASVQTSAETSASTTATTEPLEIAPTTTSEVLSTTAIADVVTFGAGATDTESGASVGVISTQSLVSKADIGVLGVKPSTSISVIDSEQVAGVLESSSTEIGFSTKSASVTTTVQSGSITDTEVIDKVGAIDTTTASNAQSTLISPSIFGIGLISASSDGINPVGDVIPNTPTTDFNTLANTSEGISSIKTATPSTTTTAYSPSEGTLATTISPVSKTGAVSIAVVENIYTVPLTPSTTTTVTADSELTSISGLAVSNQTASTIASAESPSAEISTSNSSVEAVSSGASVTSLSAQEIEAVTDTTSAAGSSKAGVSVGASGVGETETGAIGAKQSITATVDKPQIVASSESGEAPPSMTFNTATSDAISSGVAGSVIDESFRPSDGFGISTSEYLEDDSISVKYESNTSTVQADTLSSGSVDVDVTPVTGGILTTTASESETESFSTTQIPSGVFASSNSQDVVDIEANSTRGNVFTTTLLSSKDALSNVGTFEASADTSVIVESISEAAGNSSLNVSTTTSTVSMSSRDSAVVIPTTANGLTNTVSSVATGKGYLTSLGLVDPDTASSSSRAIASAKTTVFESESSTATTSGSILTSVAEPSVAAIIPNPEPLRITVTKDSSTSSSSSGVKMESTETNVDIDQ